MNSQIVPVPNPRLFSSLRSLVIVDDDAAFVATLESMLAAEGYVVEGFTDPVAALERLRGGPPVDLALVDCVMPRLSGPELIDALAKAAVDVRVLLMTALSDPNFCVAPGRVNVLNKPFQVDDLLAQIDAEIRQAGAREKVS